MGMDMGEKIVLVQEMLPPSCTINVDELGNLIMDVPAEESGE